MPKKRSRGKNEGEETSRAENLELEGAESLLEKLRRQHRMLERNRKQYSDETTTILIRQRKTLDDLQNTKEKLQMQLKATINSQNETNDMKTKNTLNAILDRQSHYNMLIETQKEQNNELGSSISILENKLRNVKRRIPSAKKLEAERLAVQQLNLALENRIQQSTVKLNAILAQNTALRNSIDNLLKERDKFMLQAQRLERQLEATCTKKGDVIDQVTKAYTERDEAQNKIRSLRERIDRESQLFTHEMKKLQRALDHQSHVKAFVTTIAAGEDEDFSRRKQEAEMEEKFSPEQTLSVWRASISHLKEVSGEDSLEGLVNSYLQTENDNYTLFSFISELNNEVTSITAQINSLKQDIEEIKSKKEAKDSDRYEKLRSLKEELRQKESEVDELIIAVRNAENTLVEMKTSTMELFELLQCDAEPVQNIIGGGDVTANSVTIYLSVVEQRLHELIQLRQYLMNEDLTRPPSSRADIPEGQQEEAIAENRGMTMVHSVLRAFMLPPAQSAKSQTHNTHAPHVAGEEDSSGPFTHVDFVSTMRKHIQDTSDN